MRAKNVPSEYLIVIEAFMIKRRDAVLALRSREVLSIPTLDSNPGGIYLSKYL